MPALFEALILSAKAGTPRVLLNLEATATPDQRQAMRRAVRRLEDKQADEHTRPPAMERH